MIGPGRGGAAVCTTSAAGAGTPVNQPGYVSWLLGTCCAAYCAPLEAGAGSEAGEGSEAGAECCVGRAEGCAGSEDDGSSAGYGLGKGPA